MVIRASALPFLSMLLILGTAGVVMVSVWCIHFRGGFAWKASDKSLIFNHHPAIMLGGLIIVGGYAMVSYKAHSWKKEVKKLIHLVLHAVALILGIIGIYAAFKYHNESSIPNLHSLHSWLGIGVIVFYAIQWIYGFIIFFYPGGSTSLRSDSLPWHVLFGILIYILAVATATLGFLEKLTFLESSGLEKYGSEVFLVNFTIIVTVIYGAFVVLCVLSQPLATEEDEHSYFAI